MDSVPRVAALREAIDGSADAIAVTRATNVAYLTGFDRVFDDEDDHVVLVTADAIILFTDSRYMEAAGQAADGTVWEVRLVTDDVVASACREAAHLGVTVLAVEDSVSVSRLRRFESEFPKETVALNDVVETLRRTKSPEEIVRIAAAQQLTDRAFDFVLGVIAVGRTERDIALDLEVFMRREGSEGLAFSPIVASGPNSALPHAQVSSRQLVSGDLLKLDFGARVDGYCADMTRTVVIGSASAEQRAVYDLVAAANLAGIAAVRPGVEGRSVDAVARAVIVAGGHGEHFGHGLGHGVGRVVHEQPGLGPRSVSELLVGDVVTVEPGIYLPGWGGVRIEDLVVVESGNARVLTTSTKQLIEL